MKNPEDNSPHMSQLAKAVAERAKERPLEAFPLSGYFTLAEKPVLGTRIRIPTKWEEQNALDLAQQYIKANFNEEETRKDPRLLKDAEDTAILWHACRDEDDPLHPAFPAPDFMSKKLNSDQLGLLANLLNGVKVKQGFTKAPINHDDFDQVVKLAAAVGTEDIPDRVLGGWSREFLVHGFVQLAMRATLLEDELATLRAAYAALRERLDPGTTEPAPALADDGDPAAEDSSDETEHNE